MSIRVSRAVLEAEKKAVEDFIAEHRRLHGTTPVDHFGPFNYPDRNPFPHFHLFKRQERSA